MERSMPDVIKESVLFIYATATDSASSESPTKRAKERTPSGAKKIKRLSESGYCDVYVSIS